MSEVRKTIARVCPMWSYLSRVLMWLTFPPAPMQVTRMFADNGLPLTLPAQLGRELPECQLRVMTCKGNCERVVAQGYVCTFIRFACPAHSTGPGLEEGDKATNFDKALAQRSTELNLAGTYLWNAAFALTPMSTRVTL